MCIYICIGKCYNLFIKNKYVLLKQICAEKHGMDFPDGNRAVEGKGGSVQSIHLGCMQASQFQYLPHLSNAHIFCVIQRIFRDH
jgi:hypothetical protein